MIMHPAHLDGKPGTLPLDEVAALAQASGVPLFVDAAYMNYPTSIMGDYVRRGADLVSISAKYFGGPNAGGFIMGRQDLIAAVANVHFTRYESGKYLKYGRPLKMDRQTVIAVVVALEEWLSMDHGARLDKYRRLAVLLQDLLTGIPGLLLEQKFFTMDERYVAEPVNCLLVTVDKARCGKSADELARLMAAETPSILANHDGDRIGFCMDAIEEQEVGHIGKRIRAILG